MGQGKGVDINFINLYMKLKRKNEAKGWFSRMKMKKWFVLLLTLVLVLMMAACGGKTNSSEGNGGTPVNPPSNSNNSDGSAPPAGDDESFEPEEGAKLVVWSSGAERSLVDAAAVAFKERFGIDVTFEEVGPDGSIERMITDGPAGVGADVFLAVHDRLGSAVQAGVILPNDIHEEETIANNSEKSVEALTMDGMLFGYPLSVETTAVFYNKDLIADPLQTWDEVLEFAKTYNDVHANQYAYMWDVGNGYWSWGFFGGYDAYVFGSDGTDPNDIGLNTPQGVEAAKFFQSVKEVLPLNTADITDDLKTSLFEQGKLAMNASGPWQTQQFKDSVANLGLMEYPLLPNGKPMKPFSGVKGFLINANTPYPNAAKLFAQMITSEEFQLKNFELLGNLPSNIVVSQNEQITSDPFANVFLKQFDNSTPMPKIAEMGAFWGTHEAALTTLWNDGADPQATMDTWANNVKSGIASSQ